MASDFSYTHISYRRYTHIFYTVVLLAAYMASSTLNIVPNSGYEPWGEPIVFFKFFVTTVSLPNLVLPQYFKHRYRIELGPRVELRNRFNYLWTVAVESEGMDLYVFTTGWADFVRDNSIELADLLVFRMQSGHRFDVEIYKAICSPNQQGYMGKIESCIPYVLLPRVRPFFTIVLTKTHFKKNYLTVSRAFCQENYFEVLVPPNNVYLRVGDNTWTVTLRRYGNNKRTVLTRNIANFLNHTGLLPGVKLRLELAEETSLTFDVSLV